MATTPKSLDTLHTALKPVLQTLVEKHGAKNVQLASIRSARFDLPTVTLKDGTKVNRVKITAREDGTIDIRLIEVVEHDLIGGVKADGLGAAIGTILGLEV